MLPIFKHLELETSIMVLVLPLIILLYFIIKKLY